MKKQLSKYLSIKDLSPRMKQWLLFSIAIFLVTSWFSSGYNQSDEHFQLYEFAGIKLGFNEVHDLAWEYGQQMRPTIQVGMVVAGHRIFHFFGLDNPFVIAWLFRILSAVFSFFIALFFYKLWIDKFKDKQLKWWFFLASFFLWFLFYNGVRFNSEMWSGHIFALAIGLFWYWSTPSKWQYFLLGSLVGLSFLFRYQVAFMIAGWGLWLIFIQRENWSKLILFTFGGLIMASLGVLTDHWFYGEWVFSLWNYFEQNILLDKASHFGIDPWWHYFKVLFINGIPPFSLIYLSALVLFIWKFSRSIITWITLPFLGIHFMIAHKELRFLYTLLPFLPIAILLILQWIHEDIKPVFWQNRFWKTFIRFFWIQNALLILFITFWSIIPEMNIYKSIYYQYENDITLYGVNDTPYQMALDIHYYKRKNLCVMEVDSFSNLPFYSEDKYLIALDKRKMGGWENLPGKKTLVYSSYPDWIHVFNINNWMDRTQWWLVWEVEREEI